MSRFRIALVCAAFASATLLQPRAASAQGTDKAAAESLFLAARELMDKQQYAEACVKFAESLRLDPTLGTKLNLARCHAAEGKIATAWAEYREVAVLSRNAGQTERADTAEKLAAELEPTLPKLEITAPNPPPNFTVTRNGTTLGPGALGTKMAVDPGKQVIIASAPGYRDWTGTVEVSRGAEHAVTIPALEPLPAGEKTTPAAGNSLRTAAFVVGGIGVVGLGVGAVFGGLTLSDASRARSDSTLCPNDSCTPAGREVINGAETKALISNIALIGGGVATAAGIALFIVSAPPKDSKTTGINVRIVPSPGGLIATGVF